MELENLISGHLVLLPTGFIGLAINEFSRYISKIKAIKDAQRLINDFASPPYNIDFSAYKTKEGKEAAERVLAYATSWLATKKQ